MGIGALGVYYLSEAFVFNIICFSIISCFFISPLKQKIKWIKGFIFTTIVLAIINSLIANLIEKGMNDDELATLYSFQAFVIPIFVGVTYWLITTKITNKNVIKQ